MDRRQRRSRGRRSRASTTSGTSATSLRGASAPSATPAARWGPQASPPSTGDPALAFDGNSRIYFANIADHEGPGGNFTGPSVVVTHSDDGGLTWSPYATVARGQTALTKGKTQGP